MTSRRADRTGFALIVPFIEFYDEKNQNYYIDMLSKPWLYIFFNFRLLFEVDAYVIDRKYAVNRQKPPIKPYNFVMVYGMGVAASIILSTIFKNILDVSLQVWIIYYRVVIVIVFLSIVLYANHRRKKIIELENLDKMKKVKIKMKTSFLGNVINFVFSALQIGTIMYILPVGYKITMLAFVGSFGFVLLTVLMFMIQWAFAHFTSKDVVYIEHE